MLQALGLSQQAERVYQAMLDGPELGIAGLCEALGLAEQGVRDALDEQNQLLDGVNGIEGVANA